LVLILRILPDFPLTIVAISKAGQYVDPVSLETVSEIYFIFRTDTTNFLIVKNISCCNFIAKSLPQLL